MCRFLLVRSKEKIKPKELLSQFASMCEKSHAPDGDWQGDGWGIAWKENIIRVRPLRRLRSDPESDPESKWEIYKSLNPIWEDTKTFHQFPEINTFVVHARSAGFPQHRGNIEYNQPFISDGLCFVFNGMIKGVKLARELKGSIGAQKIFSLMQDVILNGVKNPQRIEKVLRIVDKLIINNSNKVMGMNIGVIKNDKFYVLCEYESNADYFGIKYYQNELLTLVCSESIGNYRWKKMKKGDIISL